MSCCCGTPPTSGTGPDFGNQWDCWQTACSGVGGITSLPFELTFEMLDWPDGEIGIGGIPLCSLDGLTVTMRWNGYYWISALLDYTTDDCGKTFQVFLRCNEGQIWMYIWCSIPGIPSAGLNGPYIFTPDDCEPVLFTSPDLALGSSGTFRPCGPGDGSTSTFQFQISE